MARRIWPEMQRQNAFHCPKRLIDVASLWRVRAAATSLREARCSGMSDRLHSLLIRAAGGLLGAVVRPLSLRRARAPERSRWEAWPPLL
jgi:hypothetical protein